MMRLPTSPGAEFRGSRVGRRQSLVRGSALVRSGAGRPPLGLWMLAGLLALIAAVLLLAPQGDPPAAPSIAGPSLPRPHVPSVGGPSIDGPVLPGFSKPHIGKPEISSPEIGSPNLSSPEVDIGTPSVDAPSIGTPSIATPSVDTPDVGEPTFHISFDWLIDFFSICWGVIWFTGLIPWWVILLVILVGRWLWIVWKRHKDAADAEEEADA